MDAQKNNERFFYIDCYRGIAALAVAWFHIYTAIYNPAANDLGTLNKNDLLAVVLNYIAVWGRWGVRLFFVISGFVLAFSLQRRYLINSLSSIPRYLLRRSIRLDPTYWFAIALTLGLLYVAGSKSYMDEHAHAITSLPVLLSNAFYINWLIGHPTILSVSWTLVIEIQLYILFSIILYLAYLLTRVIKLTKENAAFIIIMVMSFFSLLWHFVPAFAVPGILDYFHIFMMGALLYNSFIEKKYLPMLIVYAIVLLFSFFKNHDNYSVAVLLSSAAIYAAHYIRSFRDKLENKYLLYFGKISYCIYLLHIPVGLFSATYFVRFITLFIDYNIGVRLLAAIFSIFTTVVASHFVNKYLEEKTIRFSKKIFIGKPAEETLINLGPIPKGDK